MDKPDRAEGPATPPAPSLNALAAPMVQNLLRDAPQLRLAIERTASGATVVDAGIAAAGGLEAGRRIAEICLGGLGRVAILDSGPAADFPLSVHVHTAQPVLACLGSQYAGWSLSHGEGKQAFQALGSGPGRALSLKEPLFQELGYRDRAAQTCLVLEVDKPPPQPLLERIAADCGVQPPGLTVILTPTRSLAGTVQIAARSLEVALHKAHALGFALSDIMDGAGSAPLPPPGADFITAMGRTNDAILFGGSVHLFVRGEEAAARQLALALPSSVSRDYGRPFAQVFKSYDYDFFQIDPMLFSPARVRVTALATGNSFSAGRIDAALLQAAFGTAS